MNTNAKWLYMIGLYHYTIRVHGLYIIGLNDYIDQSLAWVGGYCMTVVSDRQISIREAQTMQGTSII